MYAKHGNFVDAGASGAKTPWIIFRGHSRSRFWDHWKADERPRITV